MFSSCPGWVAQLVGASSGTPKRLWVRFLGMAHTYIASLIPGQGASGRNWPMFLSLSKIKEHILRWRLKKYFLPLEVCFTFRTKKVIRLYSLTMEQAPSWGVSHAELTLPRLGSDLLQVLLYCFRHCAEAERDPSKSSLESVTTGIILRFHSSPIILELFTRYPRAVLSSSHPARNRWHTLNWGGN